MKQVVLHFKHCRSSSGNSSKATLSESVTPCKRGGYFTPKSDEEAIIPSWNIRS